MCFFQNAKDPRELPVCFPKYQIISGTPIVFFYMPKNLGTSRMFFLNAKVSRALPVCFLDAKNFRNLLCVFLDAKESRGPIVYFFKCQSVSETPSVVF